MSVPKEKLEELQRLQAEYERLRALQTTLTLEVERLAKFKTDTELAIKELEELGEGREALVPLGPVLVKSKLEPSVLYPLGANIYLKTDPKDAKKRLDEKKKEVEEELKLLQAELAKVGKAMSSIEAKVAEIYRELSLARASQAGAEGTGKRGS